MTELQHAIASLNEDESSYGKEDLATEKSILSACLGLLTHSKASGIVGLVHSSARDVILGQLRLNNQSSEVRIGKACLRYMSSPEMAKGPCLSLQGLKTRLITMPFLEYSTRHYGYHVRPVQNELLTELMAFLGDENLRGAAWQLLHFVFNINSDSAQGVVESMPKGASILHVACYWGFASVLERFLSAKPNADVLNFPDSHGWTGLHWAASTGHADIVGKLLDAGTNLEAVDRGNWTPLFWAVVKGHVPVVGLLLEREANMFHVDGSHFTPLHWSVLSGARDITALLLERGEDFRHSHIMSDGKSVPARSLSVEQAKALEAPVKFKNLFELTLQTSDIGGFEQLASSFKPYNPFGYHIAGLNLKEFDQAWDRTKIILSKNEGLLLGRDKDTTTIDAVRRRLLVTAIQCEDLETVKSIVQLSMDMNKDLFTEVVTSYGASYVHVAAYSASTEVMQLLIDKGFPLEVKDKRGMTPLHYACRTGTRQIIEMLLKAGVDVDAKVGAQVECTALMLLLYFGAQRTCESPGEALDLVQLLVASGASVHATDSGGNTVMHHAMMCLDPTVVQALLDLGADLGTPNDYGGTPLHTLAGGDSKDWKVCRIDPCWEGFHQREFYLGVPSHDLKAAVVKLVLQGSPARAFTATTRNGNSALALAIHNGKWILAQALYKADAPFLFTGDLSECLEGVSKEGFYEFVRLLFRHGARPNAKNLVDYICVVVPGQKPHPWTSTRSSVDDTVECFPLRDDAMTIRELLGVEVEETKKIYLLRLYSGVSAIQIAAERGVNAGIVKALLEGGADPYAQTETGMDSFLFALVCGKQDNLEILLDHAIADTHPRAHWLTDYLRNPDANLQHPTSDIYLSALQHADLVYSWDMEGHTLLFHAITESNPVLANNLLARGADPNAADPFGWTPVHEAVRTENVALLRLLLAHGGDVFATVSDIAPFSASRAISALDYQSPDAAAINALHLAAGCNPHPDDMEARARLSPDMVRLLLELGFDPNGRTRNTGNLLLWRAKEGGETPLDIMFWEGRFDWDERFFEVVEMLVDKGAEVGRVVDRMKVRDVVEFEGREGLWDRFRASPGGLGKEKLAEWVDALDVD
jgi:ankyrin repeat protein